MRYYRLLSTETGSRLAVEVQDGILHDLTSLDENLVDLKELAQAANLSGLSIDEIASRVLSTGDATTFNLNEVIQASETGDGDTILDLPFDPPEVWAAGVTYKSSEMERRRESDTPDVYSNVYAADRPELFMKATPDRCVGPYDAVGVRGDSNWDVPEPELAFVVFDGEIIGYTVGNDVSSRAIEGENPLYLPQAKVFDRCCSIGPCFVTAESIGDPQNLSITCSISRLGIEVFKGETSTSEMSRECVDIADWLYRHNSVPNLTTVLTGTAIVPPPEFTLKEGDVVTMSIENIGTLVNDVIDV